MATPGGFEPPAYRLGGGRSVQLSYGAASLDYSIYWCGRKKALAGLAAGKTNMRASRLSGPMFSRNLPEGRYGQTEGTQMRSSLEAGCGSCRILLWSP